MEWIPTGDTVILKKVDLSVKEKGGLLIPQSVVPELEYGKVVKVGPGSYTSDGKRMDLGLKVGDLIVFNKQVQSQRFLDDGEEYLMLRGIAVLAYKREEK